MKTEEEHLKDMHGIDTKKCKHIILETQEKLNKERKRSKNCLASKRKQFDEKLSNLQDTVKEVSQSLERKEDAQECLRRADTNWDNKLKCIENVIIFIINILKRKLNSLY